MSTTCQGACVQTFAKVVNRFVDRCLWQVIAGLLSNNMILRYCCDDIKQHYVHSRFIALETKAPKLYICSQ